LHVFKELPGAYHVSKITEAEALMSKTDPERQDSKKGFDENEDGGSQRSIIGGQTVAVSVQKYTIVDVLMNRRLRLFVIIISSLWYVYVWYGMSV